MFAQPYDHSFNDLFNQYVNVESSSTDGNRDVSFSGDFDQIFQLDSLSSECGDLSPTVSTAKQARQSSPESWGKDLWTLQQDASSSEDQSSFAFHNDTVRPTAISDLSQNFEASPSHPAPAHGPSSKSPSTPPATPNQKSHKGAPITPKSIRRQETNERRNLLRKQSFSPSFKRSSQQQKGRMAYPEAWAQRFQNFNFHGSDEHLPLSPPPSDILFQHGSVSSESNPQMNHSDGSAEMPHQYEANIFNQSPAISMPSPSAGALARQQQRYLNHANNSALPTSSPPSADDIFSSPHSSGAPSMSSWHSDSFGAPALFTPDLNSHDAQAWWSPMPSRVAQRPSYQPIVASPASQRPVQNPDMMQGGLMIQFDNSFDMSNAQSSFPSSTMPSAPTNPESHYNHAPPPTFTTPQVPNPPRTPSLSPKSGAQAARNGAYVKTPQRCNNTKFSTQTMSAPKPVKAATKSSSPRGNKAISVSFVNFTANDSNKILGGVAPSGSSKTKARREQEAKDRRRKLSEAALTAVRRAGGDVEALEAIFC